MKIYTYYQDIGHPHQNKLVNAWSLSWSHNGYTPVILNINDAKKHPFFKTLDKEMRRIFTEITDRTLGDYGMSCWHRWLAYATQEEKKCYVSDYDVINTRFPVTEPDDKLHLMDDACPCLASGRPSQFESLCHAFVDVSNTRMETLKQIANHYHDQEFFMYNFLKNNNPDWEEYRNKYDIKLSRDRTKRCGSYDLEMRGPSIKNRNLTSQEIDNYETYHISHFGAGGQLKVPRTHETLNEMRIKIIEDIFNKYKIN